LSQSLQLKLEKFEYRAKVHFLYVKQINYTHYMQSEIFQAFICYNFDDYGLQI